MAPANARTTKFKNIIKELNKSKSMSVEKENSFAAGDYAGKPCQLMNQHHLQYPTSKEQKENLPTAEKDDWAIINPQALQHNVLNPTFKTLKNSSSLSEAAKCGQQIQRFSNRKSSCSSCSESGKDFSPASDDDIEYKPSSRDNSSSSYEKPKRDTKKKIKSVQRKILAENKSLGRGHTSRLSNSSSGSDSETGNALLNKGILRQSITTTGSSSASSNKEDEPRFSGECNPLLESRGINNTARSSSSSAGSVSRSGKASGIKCVSESSSSNESSSSSSGSDSDSNDSSSDSTSSSSDSSSTNSISETDKEVSPPPAKQKRFISAKKNTEDTATPHKNQPLSSLQLLAKAYTSSSDCEENFASDSEVRVVNIKLRKGDSNESCQIITNNNESSNNLPNSLHIYTEKNPLTLKNIVEIAIKKFGIQQPANDEANLIRDDVEKNQDGLMEVELFEPSIINDPPPHDYEPPNFNNPLSLKLLAMKTLNNIIDSTTEINLPCQSTNTNLDANSSPKKSRKRKRGINKRALAMKLRNMGLGYKSSRTNAPIPAREMGNPCNDHCRLKCFEKFTQEQRELVFDRYWNMGSLSQQREFIAKHMTEIKPKYQYKKIDSNRKPKHAFYLTVDGLKQKVCKIYFKRTLGINDRPIRTVIEKLNSSGMIEPDLRGKHEKHNQASEELVNGVRRHINSIPRIESHYLRKQTKREFIDGGKTVTDLYGDYKKECQDREEDYVKIHTYRKIFNEDFNISFFIPKKDQCNDCVTYDNAERQEKDKLEENHRNHLSEKEKSREEKAKDKQAVDETNIVACYDLQAMLQVPKGDVSSFYYKSRLNCLNFTICELKTDHTECYFWTEVEGQKGANEIGTCVFRYLREKSTLLSDNLNIIFYSDNCCGQQKNQFVFSMYIYAVKNLLNIQSITHKFLIKGHTQNEGDAAHSTIERQVKKSLKSGPIYVPDQYINAIREAKKKGKKYIVKEMSHSEFYDIKSLQEFKLTKNTEGETIKVNDIKVIRIQKADTDAGVKITYKTSYLQEEFKEIKLQKQNRARPQLKRLYLTRIPLGERKKEDLKSLIRQRAIPPYYASSFYNSIVT